MNRVPHPVIILVLEIFTTLISALVALLSLTSLSGVPLSLLLFLLPLLRLGWLLLPVRRLRTTSIWTVLPGVVETLSHSFVSLLVFWTPYALSTLFDSRQIYG